MPIQHPFSQINADVTATRGDEGRQYVKRITSTMRTMRSHIIPPSKPVERWMTRYGIKVSDWDEWTLNASQAAGVSNLEVCLTLRLFTEEIPGIKSDPLCGESPRCGDCGLSDTCPHHTGVGKPPPGNESVKEKLLRGTGIPPDPEKLLSHILFGEAPDERQNTSLHSLMLEYEPKLGDLINLTAGELRTRFGFESDEAIAFLAVSRLFTTWRESARVYSVRFASGRDFFNLYHLRMRDLNKEQFWVTLLNQQHEFIGEAMVSEGLLTETPVHPREAFSPAIRVGAAAVAFVHNHPGGDPTPSPGDLEITTRLVAASQLLGIRVLDHVIIGGEKFYSFAEYGKLRAK
ncbi:MAG: JAB domain-containing protein [Planctomycetota bacterium]